MAGFATIGHARRDPAEFRDMLRAAGVGLLADVRRFPRSRANPAYNIERLPDDLAQAGITYRHLPALGGRRAKQPGIDPALNGYWQVAVFHNYADYAQGPDFAAGFAELLALAQGRCVALMCAETLWWRCHRRIIADWLLLNGHSVTHLLAPGQSEPARPTPAARLTPDGKVIYPAGGSLREAR